MKSTWKQACLLGLPLALAFGVMVMLAQTGNPAYKPKRINRAVELLADKQPIYYTGSHTGAPGGAGGPEASFEQGKKDAQTYADYISYDMEHTAYDIVGLTAYMKGLVAGGPTKSGHRTPAVIANCPVNGLDEVSVVCTESCSPMPTRRAPSKRSLKPSASPSTRRESGRCSVKDAAASTGPRRRRRSGEFPCRSTSKRPIRGRSTPMGNFCWA